MTPPSESTSGLVELEKRLEQAKEGSRPLDGALFAIAEGREWQYGDGALPFYTSSIDAALALVSCVLPGYGYSMSDYKGGRSAMVFLHPPHDGPLVHVESKTIPLALCLALVRARKASVP